MTEEAIMNTMAIDTARVIADELGVKTWQVQAAIDLMSEGNTVPFIARYRKEKTGELKDEQLRDIEERHRYLENLAQRKADVVASITEQGKMTEALAQQLAAAMKLQEVEDLYLPYRPKKRTRASMARDRGLETLMEYIVGAAVTEESAIAEAAQYITDEVPDAAAALQGAMDILAEDVSNRADIRSHLRDAIWNEGSLHTALVGDDEEVKKVFLQYEDYEEPIRQLPSHRILAINRGESLGALKVTMVTADERYIAYILNCMVEAGQANNVYTQAVAEDAYKRLVLPALERDIRNQLTEQAEEQAIKVFGTNLRNLLLQPPLSGYVIMGLDPGYRMGCKMAIIDEQGNVLDQGVYYLTMSDKQRDIARQALSNLIRKWHVTLISIGNGTASYETEQFVSQMLAEEQLDDCHYIITNEAGASVYSASKLAIEELPDLDVSIRGAVSIARRVQDPLAESVKIDPKSIGVGQYQHDVNQKRLGEALDQVVETVVNHVGVELNTASPAILRHISGITGTVANNIVTYRKENGPFTSRKELLKVSRLGPAAFTQCAGFLRIQRSANALDNTPVHPESYSLAEKMIHLLGFTPEDMHNKDILEQIKAKVATVDATAMANELDAGVPTVRDILEALAKPGRDPREDLPAPLMRKHVLSLDDIKVGTVVKGTVHNVVDFGAFVDFGLKVNGLLHRSEFCRRNQHPSDVLAVGDIIEAEIISVEAERNRIGLSMNALKKRRGEMNDEDNRSGREKKQKQDSRMAGTDEHRKNGRPDRGQGQRNRNGQHKNRRQRDGRQHRDKGFVFGDNDIRIVRSKKK